MDLFLYGLLGQDAVFDAVARSGPGSGQPATLDGQGAGRLWRGLSADQQARVATFEQALGGVRRAVTVTLDDGTSTVAQTWFAPGDPDVADRAETPEVGFEIAAEIDSGKMAADLARQLPMIRHRAAARVRAAGTDAPATVRRPADAGPAGLAPRILRERARAGGFFRFLTLDLDHPTFDGGRSDRLTRDVFVGVDAAIVLPYDPVRDRVLLVEQFRVGPFLRADPDPWMLEPVAGLIDADETPDQAARREAIEEAGLRLDDLELMFQMYPSPGGSTDHFTCYLGRTDLADLASYRGGLPEENEDLRLHVLPFEAALALIDTGEVQAGPLIAMLLWLAAYRQRTRATA